MGEPEPNGALTEAPGSEIVGPVRPQVGKTGPLVNFLGPQTSLLKNRLFRKQTRKFSKLFLGSECFETFVNFGAAGEPNLLVNNLHPKDGDRGPEKKVRW